MSVRGVVDRIHASFDTAAAMADVAAVCGFDRYQASSGVMAAAEYVAARAEEAGLADVRLLKFPADGGRRWWSFRAPTSWTPLHAELTAVTGPSGVVSEIGAAGPSPWGSATGPFTVSAHSDEPFTVAAYPDEPFTLAAHSAPTGPEGVEVPVVRAGSGTASLRGALAVHDDPAIPLARALAQAEREGALGLVTDQVSEDGQVGRVELRGGTSLLAFSVPPGRLAGLLARGRARVTVTAHDTAPMPLVTGLIPGDEATETLLYAHLCHPRPSANDNASGVAALLGIARVLAGPAGEARRGFGARSRRGIRFVWAPEFTGMAAYLHDVAASVPMAAVNVDMAGEDQRLCGGPLIVERAPDHLPGFVSALAEHVVTLLPQAARSYTGAVACDTWAWRATPFVGASDHSLLADRSIGCPAVTLGHWPDRFNHSSADTLDKVDPEELRRTATVAGATIAVLSTATPADRPELEAIATRWAASRLLECLPSRAPSADISEMSADGTERHTAGEADLDARHGVLEAGRAGALLWHRTDVAMAALGLIDELCGDRGGSASRRWIQDLATHIATLFPAFPASPAPADARAGGTPSIPRRTWEGPFNLRGLAEAATPDGREWIGGRLAEERARGYALMLALAHAVDGARDREAVARYAEHATGLPVEDGFAGRFLDILVEAGWAAETATVDEGKAGPDGGAVGGVTAGSAARDGGTGAPAHA
ncbi:DUF4910 domain-containing protein [Sphaerisporangium sp. NPDC051011]|uniref:DUF4910 domain-containing protein n=1 Tax=Sphaerisporangium sp. NPDC051011 TaxID=3155792 RepID=UPI0033C688C8